MNDHTLIFLERIQLNFLNFNLIIPDLTGDIASKQGRTLPNILAIADGNCTRERTGAQSFIGIAEDSSLCVRVDFSEKTAGTIVVTPAMMPGFPTLPFSIPRISVS